MKIPVNIGAIHFIGIGGIGMSGIAEALHNLGYHVQGSDVKHNSNIERLQKKGIKIFIGHSEKNLDNVAVTVVSTAVAESNIEYQYAEKNAIPIVRRAEMLAELMRFKRSVAVAGSHGKTTTTSLIAAILAAGGKDPTIINGGIINEYGTNSILGDGEWMVVEADESDGSFLKLPCEVAVVTNIDPEHLDHYGNFEQLRLSFIKFIQNIPFYGFAVICIDNENVRSLIKDIKSRKIITYGKSEDAQIRFIAKKALVDEQGEIHSCFDVFVKGSEKLIENLCLPMYGEHNMSNACAAIAVAVELEISLDDIRKAFKQFLGVKRRFTYVGSWNNIRIFDDYAHHPTEIKAVLKSAKENCKGRVIAVMQPHRYTRLRDLFEEFSNCFIDADEIVLCPVYPAGEQAIEGINSESLKCAIEKNTEQKPHLISDKKQLTPIIKELCQADDFVVCLGAGDITNWAAELPKQLKG